MDLMNLVISNLKNISSNAKSGRRTVMNKHESKINDLSLPQEERLLRSAYHQNSGVSLPGLTEHKGGVVESYT